MVRRVSVSQFNSMLRQAEQKRRQAIDQLNRDLRNRQQELNQFVTAYNREVNAHNARVRANQQRLKNELARLSRQTAPTRYAAFQVSVTAVHTAYERFERFASGAPETRYDDYLDLSEREAANSAQLMNALIDGAATSVADAADSPESELTPVLQGVSPELGARWRGALYSLSPHNPDAARHFCTSAREIIARILAVKAPDDAVLTEMPNCDRTPQGTPTRRAKIRYFLHRRGMNCDELEAFVESDMKNVVELFTLFNEGTHGEAGTFTQGQLAALRKRVEDGILFLSRVVVH
jgi:hypothetical protein